MSLRLSMKKVQGTEDRYRFFFVVMAVRNVYSVGLLGILKKRRIGTQPVRSTVGIPESAGAELRLRCCQESITLQSVHMYIHLQYAVLPRILFHDRRGFVFPAVETFAETDSKAYQVSRRICKSTISATNCSFASCYKKSSHLLPSICLGASQKGASSVQWVAKTPNLLANNNLCTG